MLPVMPDTMRRIGSNLNEHRLLAHAHGHHPHPEKPSADDLASMFPFSAWCLSSCAVFPAVLAGAGVSISDVQQNSAR